MKRIILFISIIGLFSLVSCGDKENNNESSSSNQIIDNSNQNEPSDNISSSENDNSLSTPSESKEDVYDDNMSWGPLH